MRFNATLAMNDWLLTPPMQLTQDSYYKVRFYYRGATSNNPEKMALYWGTQPTEVALTNQMFVNENITNITYTYVEAIMQAPSDGIYYFGFKGYSDMDMFYIYLDTVSISVWVEVLNPPTNLAAAITGHDVHLTWNAPIISR